MRGTVRPLGGDQVTPRSQALARRLGSAETVLPNHLLRHICRDIQYRWIFRQNTVHLCPPRPPADGQREDAARPRRTRMEPANVPVKCAHGPWPNKGQHTPYLKKPNFVLYSQGPSSTATRHALPLPAVKHPLARCFLAGSHLASSGRSIGETALRCKHAFSGGFPGGTPRHRAA
jgi:hypothetical protein